MYTDLNLQIPGLRWAGVNMVKSTIKAGKLEAPLLEVDPGTISTMQQTDTPVVHSLVPNKRCFENKIQTVGGQCMIPTEERTGMSPRWKGLLLPSLLIDFHPRQIPRGKDHKMEVDVLKGGKCNIMLKTQRKGV